MFQLLEGRWNFLVSQGELLHVRMNLNAHISWKKVPITAGQEPCPRSPTSKS